MQLEAHNMDLDVHFIHIYWLNEINVTLTILFKFFHVGDFIIEYVGEMIDEEEYKRRVNIMHKNQEDNYYFLTIDKDRMLDAGPKGNVARFVHTYFIISTVKKQKNVTHKTQIFQEAQKLIHSAKYKST